ncbi:MAG: hypothetical protein EBE86_011165 [Hormoscilla sp. GUM202]|nr:hypothetical protein [Hormoscilla sp. GM7CHS1pb]MBO1347913.1 hypothetical protein [Hormoscilla sp. GUM202]
MVETRTWRRGSGLIDWTYNLADRHHQIKQLLADGYQRRIWIADKIERLLDALGNFALVQDVTVDTWSGGEDSLAIASWQGAASRLRLVDFLQKTDEVVNIDFTLTLQCATPKTNGKLKELQIESGGSIFFFIELEDEGKLDLNTDTPIWLTFSLDVDIHAPISWGPVRDNTQNARLNGSRLSAFLHRLEQDIPAEFIGVDAPDYQGMVDRYGFFTPSIVGLDAIA